MLRITPAVCIDFQELKFTHSRSSGPGGQNVNKLNTRVTVSLDIANSPTLTDLQKQRILSKLSSRITNQGVLQVTSQASRTQNANRTTAIKRLTELLSAALKTNPPRKKRKVSYAAKQKRLQSKKRRSDQKKLRASINL